MMSSVHVVIVLAILLWLAGLAVVLVSIARDARRTARAAEVTADAAVDLADRDPDADEAGAGGAL